jgi:hypothetical protein
MRAKKRLAEQGFSTLAQQLADLGEYLKRFKPREVVAPAAPEVLADEVAEIGRALRVASLPSHVLVRRARSVHARIEAARAQVPDEDHDHDAYVDIEEQLWDLGFPTPD